MGNENCLDLNFAATEAEASVGITQLSKGLEG